MRYYIDTIEQVKTEDGGVNEYGARTIQPASKTFEEVESAYFTKLANVSNDINAVGVKTNESKLVEDSNVSNDTSTSGTVQNKFLNVGVN